MASKRNRLSIEARQRRRRRKDKKVVAEKAAVQRQVAQFMEKHAKESKNAAAEG